MLLGDDVTDKWASVDAAFSNYNRNYRTAGYSTTGYQLEDTVITYHKANVDNVSFSGLSTASSITAADVTLDSATHVFTLDEKVLDGKAVSVSGGSYAYTLALDGGNTLTTVEEVPATLINGVYTTYQSPEFYTADGSSVIAYTSITGGENITFTGLGEGASISNVLLEIGTKQFTVGAGALLCSTASTTRL